MTPLHPVTLDRLSRLADHTVTAHCPACLRAAPLDLVAVMARHGDLPLEALPQRLRCACGQRPCTITLSWAGAMGGGYARG